MVFTGFDVLIILFFQYKGFRLIESIVAGLIFVILICFAFELIRSSPDIFPLLSGLVPRAEVVTNPSMLYIAIGILGATVMPHNLYKPVTIQGTQKVKKWLSNLQALTAPFLY